MEWWLLRKWQKQPHVSILSCVKANEGSGWTPFQRPLRAELLRARRARQCNEPSVFRLNAHAHKALTRPSLLAQDPSNLQTQIQNGQMLITPIHQPLVDLREAQHDPALLPVARRLITDHQLLI